MRESNHDSITNAEPFGDMLESYEARFSLLWMKCSTCNCMHAQPYSFVQFNYTPWFNQDRCEAARLKMRQFISRLEAK